MLRLTAIALCCLILSGCKRPDTLLERIQANHEIIVVTRNAATTYYKRPQGSAELEYDLARVFAQHLGVNLRVEVLKDFPSLLKLVENGDAHFAAAGLTDTVERRTRVRLGLNYQTILPQFIYRTNGRDAAPQNLDHLSDKLEVIAGSSHEERLRAQLAEHPTLTWQSHDTQDSAELLRYNEPDRTWMALAADNVGYGHVEDARILAQSRGRDSNTWDSVKATLPLLTEQRWYKQTSHGYARGYEPVKYVENIRSYYDILIWNSERSPELAGVIDIYTADIL